jgi:ABC-type bacteriocin/lantibiotic exporter with double-glycine peptidase domain
MIISAVSCAQKNVDIIFATAKLLLILLIQCKVYIINVMIIKIYGMIFFATKTRCNKINTISLKKKKKDKSTKISLKYSFSNYKICKLI